MYQLYDGIENVTEKVSKAFLSNGRQIGVIIQFPGIQLTDEQVIQCNIEEGIISSSKFAFGTANVAVADIKVFNSNNMLSAEKLEKSEIRIFFTIKIEDKTYRVPMGLFIVDTVKEDDNKVITINAFDKLILSEENYDLLTELTYPVTLKGIAEDACKIAKISYSGEDFFNSNLTLNDMVVFGANCSCRDVLQNIAELSCTYVNCNKDGFIRFINLNNITPVGTITTNSYFKFKKLENLFGPIKSVRIARNEEVELFGEGSPQLQIDDNYFLPKDIKSLPEQIHNQISHITYTPADLEFQGNPLIEPGDFIEVIDKDGVKRNILVTNMKYTYNGGLRCVLKSAANSEMSLATEKKNIVSESVNGLNKRVNSLYQLIDKKLMHTIMQQQDQFNNRLDGLKEELKEVEMKVTPDGIVNTVTNSKQYNDVIEGIYDGLNGLAGQTVNVESIIAQFADRINMAVKKGSVISEINLDESGVQIRGDKIKLTGMVTFEDLKEEGRTIINGGNITTGTFSGDRIYGGTIEAVNIKGDIVDVMAGMTISPSAKPTDYTGGWYNPNINNPTEWSTITFKQLEGYRDSNTGENRYNSFDAVKLKVFPYFLGNEENQTPHNYKYGLEITGAIKAKDDITIEGQRGLIITGENGIESPLVKTNVLTTKDKFRKQGLTIENFEKLIPCGSVNSVQASPYIYIERNPSSNEEEQRPQLFLASDKYVTIKSQRPDKFPSLRLNSLYIDGSSTPSGGGKSTIYTTYGGARFVRPDTDRFNIVQPVPVYASDFIKEVQTTSREIKQVQAVMSEDKAYTTGGNAKTIKGQCILDISDVINRKDIVSVIVNPNQSTGRVWWDIEDDTKISIKSDIEEVKFSYIVYSLGGNING